MVKHKYAVLSLVVSRLPEYKADDILPELSRQIKELRYSTHVKKAENHPVFSLVNCGVTATFNLVFSDGGTPNASIPDVETIIDYLEKLEPTTYKLAVISQELEYFYRYI